MKISRLIKIEIAMFVVLSGIAVAAALISQNAFNNSVRAFEVQAKSKQLGLQLQNASDFLTAQAQAYVQYGEKKYYDAYWYEINTDKNREKAIQGLTDLGTPQHELDLVTTAGQLSNTLAELESRAFDEVENGNLDEARHLMFGDLYDQGKAPIIETMNEFQTIMNTRTHNEAEEAKNLSSFYSIISLISILLVAISGIAGLISIYVKLAPINKIVNTANQIANGNINVNFPQKSKDEIGDLTESFEKVVAVVNLLIQDISQLAAKQAMGEIDHFVDESAYSGSYKDLTSAVNTMCKNTVDDLMNIIENITNMANGNFDADIKKLPGKKATVSENLEIMRKNLKSVSEDIGSLVKDASAGKLSSRADIKKYSGDWVDLLNGLNELMETVVAPIQEAARVLSKVSDGNFQHKVEGNYKGDFLIIKNSINDMVKNVASYIDEISDTLEAISNDDLDQGITREYVGKYSQIKDALNKIISRFNLVISDILIAADQVAIAARQVSESSMSLSQGATEQASATEELNSTVITINENTLITASHSKDAENLSVSSLKNANNGNQDMANMLASMEKINDSSKNIAKIIKVIDDIAFQTNLLALNAAVEAARAGQHGKGFAVVAEEVRNLAGRSQDAANETTELIEESMRNVYDGSKIAGDTAKALNTITEDTTKISDIIKGIAVASGQQSEAIGYVTTGLSKITEVVQNNSATSEETAAASQQLSNQAEVLKNLVGVFKLKRS